MVHDMFNGIYLVKSLINSFCTCIYPTMAAITKVTAGIRLVIAVVIVEEDKYNPSKYAF